LRAADVRCFSCCAAGRGVVDSAESCRADPRESSMSQEPRSPVLPGTEIGADVAPSGPETGEGVYQVKLESFQGPLDLLLHLVRANQVEISDIPIVEITRQYNEYLELMRDYNLEIAGDYLLMAATLMHIKSRMLLPPDPDAEEGEVEDPRAELAQQLLDYQKFKQAAESLQAMETRRSLIWTREELPSEFVDEELLAVDMFDLLQAFRKLLGRLDEETRRQLKRDTVSVAEKIGWLTDLLEQRDSINLLQLISELPTRLDGIATFLALLEMLRLQLVVAFQRKLFDEIRIARRRDRGSSEDPESAAGEPAAAGGVGAAESEDGA
jgi:segregation and condensation protein A